MISWEVEHREMATNHRRIVTVISSKILNPKPKYKVRHKDLNVLKFREVLSEEIRQRGWLEGKSVDECVSFLTEKAQYLCGEQTKERKVRRKAESWWISQLLIEHKHDLTAGRRYRGYADEDNRKDYEILFRKIRSKFRRSVSRAK